MRKFNGSSMVYARRWSSMCFIFVCALPNKNIRSLSLYPSVTSSESPCSVTATCDSTSSSVVFWLRCVCTDCTVFLCDFVLQLRLLERAKGILPRFHPTTGIIVRLNSPSTLSPISQILLFRFKSNDNHHSLSISCFQLARCSLRFI